MPDDLVGLGSDWHVELDHEYLTLGEDVGLSRSRNSDDARDRVRRLELGGDDEVDVELALPPDFEVLDVLRSDDRARTRREPLGKDAGDDVDLVAGRACDHEIGPVDPGLLENAAASTVALESQDVVPVGERAELGRIGVDHGHRVLVVERLDDRRPDLAGPDDEDLHRRRLCIISSMQSGGGTVIQVVVFDMDGVLLDSEAVWDAVREALVRERGGRWHEGAQRDMMGMSAPEWSCYMHEELGLPESPAEIDDEVVRRMAASYREHLPLIPGAIEAVERTSQPTGRSASRRRRTGR